jgi:hypothetical protein
VSIKIASQNDQKTIDRSIVDALLQGISKALDSLGKQQKNAIVAEMEEFMLEYLVDAKMSEEKPADSLEILLTKNGYGPTKLLRSEGKDPSSPEFGNSLDYWLRAKQGNQKVDWEVYEMILYSLTKVLDERLGAQAQMLLDQIGREILDFLVERKLVEPSDDIEEYTRRVLDFFMRAGYAGMVEVKMEGSPPDTFVAEYKDARYYENVLGPLRSAGNVLFSCPMCLATQTIPMRKLGIKLQYATMDFRLLPENTVSMRIKILQPAERFTEEDAERISKMPT